jgi:hypothetical protein
MRDTLTATLRAIKSKIRGEHLDAQAQQIADRMVEELRAAVADLQETRQDIGDLAKQWVYPATRERPRKIADSAPMITSARWQAGSDAA